MQKTSEEVKATDAAIRRAHGEFAERISRTSTTCINVLHIMPVLYHRYGAAWRGSTRCLNQCACTSENRVMQTVRVGGRERCISRRGERPDDEGTRARDTAGRTVGCHAASTILYRRRPPHHRPQTTAHSSRGRGRRRAR